MGDKLREAWAAVDEEKHGLLNRVLGNWAKTDVLVQPGRALICGSILTHLDNLLRRIRFLESNLDHYNQDGGHCAQAVNILTRTTKYQANPQQPGYLPHAVDAALHAEYLVKRFNKALTELQQDPCYCTPDQCPRCAALDALVLEDIYHPPDKIRHVCGLQGFGHSLDDKCPACEANKSTRVA